MLRSTPGPAEEVLGFFRWFFGVVLALGVGVVFCSLLVVSQAVFSAIFPADFAPELASSTMTMAGEVAFMSSEGCCFLAASWLGSSMLGVSASFLFSFLRPDRERIGYVSIQKVSNKFARMHFLTLQGIVMPLTCFTLSSFGRFWWLRYAHLALVLIVGNTVGNRSVGWQFFN